MNALFVDGRRRDLGVRAGSRADRAQDQAVGGWAVHVVIRVRIKGHVLARSAFQGWPRGPAHSRKRQGSGQPPAKTGR